jgi:hypothetical protein
MSKKETRRAARQAFPKAKTAATSKGRAGTRYRSGASAAGSKNRAVAQRGPKPPTLRRAMIQGAIMAVLFFVVIQFLWKTGSTTAGNIIVALLGFILYSGVAYGVDWFKYRRATGKPNGTSKR